jgi:hypothetical protein
MVHATSKRRGHGEDSIYRDASPNRYIGAVDLGFSTAGTRIRKKVSGKAKVEVRDKLRELRKELDVGLRLRRRYTVSDALEDWLAHGVDGLSARTVTLYRGTIAKALKEELGGVRLTELTASDVPRALTALASGSSTRTIQIAHNVLVRAIRHAERDDLVGRNVASLVDAPKGQQAGRPSKSLTLEQTVALMTAAKGTALEAYRRVAALRGADRGGAGAAVGLRGGWVGEQYESSGSSTAQAPALRAFTPAECAYAPSRNLWAS